MTSIFRRSIAASLLATAAWTATPALAQDDGDLTTMLVPQVTIDPEVSDQIRIARTHSGQILLPASVNGQNLGWWMLDTASSDNTIDVRAAAELGLEESGTMITLDHQGIEQNSRLFKDVDLTVGNATIQMDAIVGVDMLPIATMVGQPVIGVIGASSLNQMVIRLDLEAPVATVRAPGGFDDEDLDWVTVLTDKQCPVLDATVDGIEGTFVLDTGMGFGVEFTPTAVGEHNLLEDRETREWTSVNVGGRSDVFLGFIDSLQVNGETITALPAIFGDPNSFAGVFPEQTGHVGTLALRHFVTTLDLGRSRVAMTPLQRAAPAGDLKLADLVGTYRDPAGGAMVLNWDGETVTAILGAGQPELTIHILEDDTFYFNEAWIEGEFLYRQGVLLGMRMQLPDGQTRRAFKVED